ncbi:hypothetical protein [Kitasatospora sp. NPDC056731]|uniref:hypothetical protein n=1 Tax=Kitasatospora sp. NPDC056731 TaxID=3155422 RepID=UPI00342E884E
MRRLSAAVDRLLAAVEAVSISRWHILALLFLGAGLLTQGGNQAFELIGGNYTNVISATVSLLVLAEQKRAEARQVDRHEQLKGHIEAQASEPGEVTP